MGESYEDRRRARPRQEPAGRDCDARSGIERRLNPDRRTRCDRRLTAGRGSLRVSPGLVNRRQLLDGWAGYRRFAGSGPLLIDLQAHNLLNVLTCFRRLTFGRDEMVVSAGDLNRSL